jgi:hypothetical protein
MLLDYNFSFQAQRKEWSGKGRKIQIIGIKEDVFSPPIVLNTT